MKTKLSLTHTSCGFCLRFASSLALATLIAFCPLQVRADTIALTFGSYGNAIIQGGTDVTLGWAFSLTNPLLLTQLGVFDSTGSGLSTSRLVTIWTSTGVQEAQGTVPAGAGPETNSFRYVSIAPVLLSAGTYTIGAFYPSNLPFDAVAYNASSITTASGVSYIDSRGVVGNAFPPGNFLGQANGYFGPNFQFTSVPDSASTGLLLLLGLTAIVGLRRIVRQPV